jgi:hypothetical protein
MEGSGQLRPLCLPKRGICSHGIGGCVDPMVSRNVLEKKKSAPSPVEGPQFSFHPVYGSRHIIIIIIIIIMTLLRVSL